MSRETPRLPPTPRSGSSSVRIENAESGSSRNSDSPIRWTTLLGADSQTLPEIKPSSWDNSDDELPLTVEGASTRGHIYSSETPSNRKSVTAEINELKKQFFESGVLEKEMGTEDSRGGLEMKLKSDRRKSPARVRRRTKSSSSSSTAMDITTQGSPKRDEELASQGETIFDNAETVAPLLQLDSKFYLDNFFAELRRKRISVLGSPVAIADERDDEDFGEDEQEDPDEFSLNDGGYYNRTSRKLSQILEVEENKKDSDKDVEEYAESNDLFLKFPKKSEDSDYSPLYTARSKKDEKLFENLRGREYKFKSSSAELEKSEKVKQTRECLSERETKDIPGEWDSKVISLTAKTGTIRLNSPEWGGAKTNNADLHQIHDDDDVNWNFIENLKLDLMRSSENPTPRRSSRRERNSGSESKRSAREGSLQSPKFMINLGKESGRSLKVEEIKTPNSLGKNSVGGSDKFIKDQKNSSGSAVQEGDLKSPSLASRTSNRSLEFQDNSLNRGANTNRDTQRSDYTNEARNQAETSNRSLRSNQSEYSSRSTNSKSSRSSRSYRLSSRADESRTSSQRSEKLKLTERVESRRSPSVSPRTELELLRQTNGPPSQKSSYRQSRNRESEKSTSRLTQSTTPETSGRVVEDTESKNRYEKFDNADIPGAGTSEWIDVEKIQAIPSNRSEKLFKSQRSSSSRSEIIIAENFDKSTRDDSADEPGQRRNSLRKSVIIEHLDDLDYIVSSRSTKNKSRPNSCVSEERTSLSSPLNIDRSEEVIKSERITDRSGIIEEFEDTLVRRLKSEESDSRLSAINEASLENIESRKAAEDPKESETVEIGNSEETIRGKVPTVAPLTDKLSNESITKPEPQELWNDLIETFSKDQPFNWQDNFLGFLNPNQDSSVNSGKEVSSPGAKDTKFTRFEDGGKEDDFILSRGLQENTLRSPRKSEKISSPKKHVEKKDDLLDNLDIDIENNFKQKMRNDSDAQNLYYLQVQKTGDFGIGEFGDVTCWNLGVSDALEEGKPKGSGDGILSQCRKESPILNQDDSIIEKQMWINFKSIENSTSKVKKPLSTNDDFLCASVVPSDWKSSKSDTCINTKEFSQNSGVDFSYGINKKSPSIQRFASENQGKRKRKASVSSVQYSSSDCVSDETDNPELEFEFVRRSASLTDIPGHLYRSGYEKLESNENLYNSRSRLYDHVGKWVQNKDSTDGSVFLPTKKQEDKSAAKSSWLLFKHSRGKTCHREDKKSKSRLKIDKSLIKKDSKEYLSFRSRHSVPVLKLRDSNCFQNFYKRVISVFCLTSDSSLPTSK